MSLVKIAVITAAHGIRGEVKLRVYLENPEDVFLYAPLFDKAGKPYILKRTGAQGDIIIAKIDGITDRNQSELLRGVELLVEASKLPFDEQSDSAYYIHELVGLRAVTESSVDVGAVIAVHNFGAGDIIEIQTATDEIMLPFSEPFVGKVDRAKKTIIVMLPDYVDL